MILTACDSVFDRSSLVDADALTVIEPAICAGRISLRGGSALATAVESAIGVRLQARVGDSHVHGGWAALTLGPDEWMLLQRGDVTTGVLALSSLLRSGDWSAVDVTDRQEGYRLSGILAAGALAAGCPIDLRERAFPAGHCARTLLGKAEVIVWRPQADSAFHLETWRSFAPYVEEFLRRAIEEAG